MLNKIQFLFEKQVKINGNLIEAFDSQNELETNQSQTMDTFSDKWDQVSQFDKLEETFEFQRNWFLELYGFKTIENFKEFLADKKVIVDYGSGLGYKSAWMAELAPHAIVVGVEISESVQIASKQYEHIPNVFFLQGDIAATGLKQGSVDFSICDQVIMHTEEPEVTFKHIVGVTSKTGVFGCYVYAKKALPRELVDDYFRAQTHNIPSEDMWELSKQLAVLGKTLSELDIQFESPDIPILGIKGGKYDLQRFIYWNFLKCFWNPDLGFEISYGTNYDWYAPSNAKRYSKAEFLEMASENNLEVINFHQEEACYSACFKHK